MGTILFIDNSSAVESYVRNEGGFSSDVVEFFNTTSDSEFSILNPESVPDLEERIINAEILIINMEAVDPNGQEPLENIFSQLRYETGYEGHIIALEPSAEAKDRMAEYFKRNGMSLIKSVDLSRRNYSPTIIKTRKDFLRKVARSIKEKIGSEPLLPGEEEHQQDNPLFAAGLTRFSEESPNATGKSPIISNQSLDDYVTTERNDSELIGRSLVIGIGDLHGHYTALQKLMNGLQRQYRIFKNVKELKLRPTVELNFTGDYIDRGTEGLRVIKALMRLQNANPNNVNLLLGNHELLALSALGRVRTAVQDGNYKPYAKSAHGFNGGLRFIMEFGSYREDAFENYLERMQRSGDIGSWMRQLKPLHYSRVNDKKILFVHGGIPKRLRNLKTLQPHTTRVQRNLETLSDQGPGYTMQYLGNDDMGRESIFWNRDFLETVRTSPPDKIARMLKKIGVDYVVLGHTVSLDRIESVEGLVFDIDVGMCPYYAKVPEIDNNPAAIIFKKNQGIFAFYVGNERREEQLVQF